MIASRVARERDGGTGSAEAGPVLFNASSRHVNPKECTGVSSYQPCGGHHDLYGRGGDRCLGSHGGPLDLCSRRCSMNRKANRACKEPGCVAYAAVGSAYCKAHGAVRSREYRSSEHKKEAARLYRTGQWQALRRQQLTLLPFCAECLKAGKYTLASEVDHVVPHRNDPQLFFDPSNLQSLCHSCHSIKTAREDGGFGRARSAAEDYAVRERIPFR